MINFANRRQLKTKLGNVQYSPNGQSVIDIPRDRFWSGFTVQMSLRQNVDATDSSRRKAYGGIFNLIKDFSIVINDRIMPINKLSGMGLYLQHKADQGAYPRDNKPVLSTLNPEDNWNYNTVFKINLGQRNTFEDMAMGLDLRAGSSNPEQIRSAKIIINWAEPDAIFTQGAGAVITNIKGVTVHGDYFQNSDALGTDRLPLRYLVENRRIFRDTSPVEVVLERNAAIDYQSITGVVTNNEGRGQLVRDQDFDIKHGETSLWEGVNLYMIEEQVFEESRVEQEDGTFQLPFYTEHSLQTGYTRDAMREDIKINIPTLYEAEKGDNTLVTVTQQVRDWDWGV